MPTLTRPTTGKLLAENFASLTNWTNQNGVYSRDTTQPIACFWPSGRYILQRTPSSPDASNIREVHGLYRSPTSQVLLYDGAPDQTSAWWINAATFPDGWITPTKLGPVSDLTHGGGASRSRDMAGFICKDATLGDGKFYLNVLDSASTTIPGTPFTNLVFSSTDPTGDSTPFAWEFDGPPLGTSGDFDDQDCYVGCTVYDSVSGEWNWFYSATDNSNTYNIGRATSAHLNASPTKDGTGGLLPVAISQSATHENPKVWTAGGFWFLAENTGAQNTQVYVSANINNWNNGTTFLFALQWGSAWLLGSQIGVSGPVYDEDGVPVTSDFGQIGWVYAVRDGAGSYDYDCASGVVDSRPTGVASSTASTDRLTTNVAHGDCVIEFELERQGTYADFSIIFRYDNGTVDGTGYLLVLSNGGTLYRMNSGGFTALATLAGEPALTGLTPSARALYAIRYKIVCSGANIKVYIDGTLQLDHTDASPIASGTWLGFRAHNGSGHRVRGLSVRTADTIAVTGAPVGATVVVRGAGGIPFDVQTADGSGNATLTSYHYPLTEVSVDDTRFVPSDGVWGGDALAYAADATGSPATYYAQMMAG